MTDRPVLVTGSAGLIGRALTGALRARGLRVAPYDVLDGRDVCDADGLAAAAAGCAGVVHLAAVSRVAWAHRDPERCRAVNEGGTRNAVRAAVAAGAWLLFTSSREVYGQPTELPATERTPLAPINTYARSKVAGERAVAAARSEGAVAASVRLCNVYGDPADHADRVVPAFCRAAVGSATLRVEGRGHTFDFVHLDDAVAGLVRLVDRLRQGEPPPTVHLSTGRGTTLGELAALCMEAGGAGRAVDAAPRDYDVSRFVGDPAGAAEVLGWRARVVLEDGVRRLCDALRADLPEARATKPEA